MATKTYDQLGVSTDVQDADLIANWRSTGPLTTVTASILKTYVGASFLPLAGGTMTGAFVAAVGTTSLPSVVFSGDLNTGLYWVSADKFGLVAGGVKRLEINSTGAGITGALSVGAVTATGDITTTTNLSVDGNTTLGNAAGDTITVTGTATFAQAITATSGINGTVGAVTPAAGTFTTVTASSTATFNGNTVIGNAGADTLTVTATATFAQAITATGGVVGNLTGNVVGSAATLTTTRSISATGDATWTVNFNGSANATAAITIAAGAVTNAKLADMATQTIKGRTTAGTGDPEDLTATQARAVLALGTSATVDTGTSGTKVALLDGANTWSGAQTFSALVTLSAGGSLTPAATPATTAIGYLGIPLNSKSGDYTTVMSDTAKDIYYTATATHTIPANASVAYPIGTAYEISVDNGHVVTIAITSDTLRWIPTNGTGSRTLTGPAAAIVHKKTATEWWITGVGLS